MFRLLTALAIVGVVFGNICTDDTGHWSFAIVDGVSDFAHGGVPLNKSNNCFEGCLLTGTLVENFKVKLACEHPGSCNNSSQLVKNYRRSEKVLNRLNLDGDDPNADSCIDATLRGEIAQALSKATDTTCKGLVRSISYNIHRPGWVINCAVITGGAIDGLFEDSNFCLYEAVINKKLYEFRLALIDTN